MVRRQRHEEEENHERWLVSYADYVTLLFALFVVMFATSNANRAKAKQLSDSVRRAYGQNQAAQEPIPRASELSHPSKPATASDTSGELAATLRMLREELRTEIALAKIQVKVEDRGIVISLREAAFFRPGDDAILPEISESIEKMARVLARSDNLIRLEGHTDSMPISSRRFATNWHLSTARALSMFGLLTADHRLEAARFTITGYGDTAPVESNATPDGRARNRRVDVVLMKKSFSRATTAEALANPPGAADLPPAGAQARRPD